MSSDYHFSPSSGSNGPSGSSAALHTLRKRARRRLVGAVVLVTVALAVLWKAMDTQTTPALAPVTIVSSNPALDGVITPQALANKTALDKSAPDQSDQAVSEATSSGISTQTEAARLESAKTESSNPTSKSALAKTDTAKPKREASKPSKPKDVPKTATNNTGANKAKSPTDKASASTAANQSTAQKAKGQTQKKTDVVTTGADDPLVFYLPLGAFSDSKKASALIAKAKQVGVSVHSEVVSKDSTKLTRISAGPYGSRETAEKTRQKLLTVGIDSNIVGK